jgi:hypothetical protein
MAKIDKILGSISPAYGMISGQGLLGKGLVAVGDALGPAAGFMPMAASGLENRRRRKKEAGEAPDAGEGMRKGGKVKKMAKGGKLPDLTGDGKVTRADVLKGRGVPGFAKGGKVTRGDGCVKKGHTKGRFV